MLADRVQLLRLRRVHAAADPDLVGRDVEIHAGAFVLGQTALRKDRGDVRLVGSLVFGEARVAVDAIDRRLRMKLI